LSFGVYLEVEWRRDAGHFDLVVFQLDFLSFLLVALGLVLRVVHLIEVLLLVQWSLHGSHQAADPQNHLVPPHQSLWSSSETLKSKSKARLPCLGSTAFHSARAKATAC